MIVLFILVIVGVLVVLAYWPSIEARIRQRHEFEGITERKRFEAAMRRRERKS